MPEVSLVAILDADKEGFLRSDRSLIQTIGRAARHPNGRAILYADVITGSMQRAMEETQRRREKQQAHNLEHGIVPQRLLKPVTDVMDLGERSQRERQAKVAEKGKKYNAKTPDQLLHDINELESRMFKHARELEFEQAAALRDQVEELRRQLVALSSAWSLSTTRLQRLFEKSPNQVKQGQQQ